MSKVFSAKRTEITATYEFADGTTTEMVIIGLSTKESNDLSVIQKEGNATVGEFVEKQSRLMLQRNDKKVLEKIIGEQNGDGNIIDFANDLFGEIQRVKKAKGNG